MFYFDYKANITNPYDYNPLQVVGYIRVYLDEAKTQHITDLAFPSFPFSELPEDLRTSEGFNQYIDQKVSELTATDEVVSKLNELKLAYDMGLINLV